MGRWSNDAVAVGTAEPVAGRLENGETALLVAVVDDDESIRFAVQTLVEREGIGALTYPNAESFLAELRPEAIGCLVLDLQLPGVNGLELQEILNRRCIHIPVIVFTAQGSIPKAVAALKNGAVDFVEKPFENSNLVSRVRACLASALESRRRASAHDSMSCRLAMLTAREREVMARIVAGRLNKHIAGELGICIKTVEYHRSRIMQKIGVQSVAELVQLSLVSAAARTERHA